MGTETGFRRGDVVTLPLPLVTAPAKTRARPAVVVQNDVGNRASPNLIVVMCSTAVPAKPYPMHLRIDGGGPTAQAAGLRRTSVVKTEVIATVPKSMVTGRIGHLPAQVMVELDRCLRVSLAL